MTILRSVLTNTALVYTIDLSSKDALGQPIESLVSTGIQIDISNLEEKHVYDIQMQGNIKLSQFKFLSEYELNIQTNIIETDSIKYRLLTRKKAQLNNKIFGYTYTCSFY